MSDKKKQELIRGMDNTMYSLVEAMHTAVIQMTIADKLWQKIKPEFLKEEK